jgi:hypothetical protein
MTREDKEMKKNIIILTLLLLFVIPMAVFAQSVSDQNTVKVAFVQEMMKDVLKNTFYSIGNSVGNSISNQVINKINNIGTKSDTSKTSTSSSSSSSSGVNYNTNTTSTTTTTTTNDGVPNEVLVPVS